MSALDKFSPQALRRVAQIRSRLIELDRNIANLSDERSALRSEIASIEAGGPVEKPKTRGCVYVVELLEKNPGLTQAEVAKELGVKYESASSYLSRLKSAGKVRRQLKRWYVVAQGEAAVS